MQHKDRTPFLPFRGKIKDSVNTLKTRVIQEEHLLLLREQKDIWGSQTTPVVHRQICLLIQKKERVMGSGQQMESQMPLNDPQDTKYHLVPYATW